MKSTRATPDGSRRWFQATLEAMDDGCSEYFEAPPGCELWPLRSHALIVDGDPYIVLLWSVAPEPKRSIAPSHLPDGRAAKRKSKRAAKRKSKR